MFQIHTIQPTLRPQWFRFALATALLVLGCGWKLAQAVEPPNVHPMRTMGNYKVIHGEADIDAPPATVWNVLTDYPNMKKILPGYTYSRLLQSNGREKKVDLILKLNPITPELRYQVTFLEERHLNRILIQRISGDFDDMSGSYKLAALNNGSQTHLVYDLQIDFGVPIPGLGFLLRNKAEADLVALQNYCVKARLHSLASVGNP